MLFLNKDGTYIELNKTDFNNDKKYYQAITKVMGHEVILTLNNTNDKLENIIKRK
jgi:hypothetical protein|tara:strand:- start:5 stop:169 length:165 start_codon:yes stop_codon:yes gene_type:complete